MSTKKTTTNRGEAHPSSKLTEAKVKAIRREYAMKLKYRCTSRTLAKKYNVSSTTITNILSGDRWAWVR